MNESKIPLLSSEDIEVKIKQVTKSGALALLYKTARTDRKILNKVFGPLNWTSDFKMVNDTLFCGIGIRENFGDPFVWKWESGGEAETPLDDGAKKKATTSDAFKRAGYAVGIGEELYSSPFIWLDVETEQRGGNYYLKDKFAKYVVTHIEYNKDTRVITELEICNAKSDVCVYRWKMPTSGAYARKMSTTVANLMDDEEDEADIEAANEAAPAPTEKPEKKKAKAEAETTSEDDGSGKTLRELVIAVGTMVKKMTEKDGNVAAYQKIVLEANDGKPFKCNTATEDQRDVVLKIYQGLVAAGYGDN